MGWAERDADRAEEEERQAEQCAIEHAKMEKALVLCKEWAEERIAADNENRCAYNCYGDLIDIVNEALKKD